MDDEVAGRFHQDNALDQRIDRTADVDLVVAHDRIVRRHADADPGSGIVPHTGQIDDVPADDRVGRRQMAGLAGPVGLDRRRVEIDEDVVLDDDGRGAVARADGTAAVDHLLFERVVGHNVLAGGENVVIRIAGTDVAHRHGARIADVVAHELHEPGGPLPGAAAHVLDPAVEHRRVLRHVVVVEGVPGAVGHRTVAVDDRLGVPGRVQVARATAAGGIEAFGGHAGRVTVLDKHSLGTLNPHGIAVLDVEAPHLRVTGQGPRAHLLALGKAAESVEPQIAERHRSAAPDRDARARAVADVQDRAFLVLARHRDSVGIPQAQAGGQAIAADRDEDVSAFGHGAIQRRLQRATVGVLHHAILGPDRCFVSQRYLVALDLQDRADQLVAATEGDQAGRRPVAAAEFHFDAAAQFLPIARDRHLALFPGQGQVVTPAEGGRRGAGEVQHVHGPIAEAAVVAPHLDLLCFRRRVPAPGFSHFPDVQIAHVGVTLGHRHLLPNLEIADLFEHDHVRSGDGFRRGFERRAAGAEGPDVDRRLWPDEPLDAHVVQIRFAAAGHTHDQGGFGDAFGQSVHAFERGPGAVAHGGCQALGKRPVGLQFVLRVILIDLQLDRAAAVAERDLVREAGPQLRTTLDQVRGPIGAGRQTQKSLAVGGPAFGHLQRAWERGVQHPRRRGLQVALQDPAPEVVPLRRRGQALDRLEAPVLEEALVAFRFPFISRRGDETHRKPRQAQACRAPPSKTACCVATGIFPVITSHCLSPRCCLPYPKPAATHRESGEVARYPTCESTSTARNRKMVFASAKRPEKTSEDLVHLPLSLTFPVSKMVDVATTSTRRGMFDGCYGDESMSMVQTDYTQVLQTVRTWPPELRQNLAGEILESLEADSPTPSVEWNQTMNARRCALIDKEIDGTLTPSERVELELLQKQAVAYRDHVAPLPIDGARKLHQQLLARKRHNDQMHRP